MKKALLTLAILILAGCASTDDFGYSQQTVATAGNWSLVVTHQEALYGQPESTEPVIMYQSTNHLVRSNSKILAMGCDAETFQFKTPVDHYVTVSYDRGAIQEYPTQDQSMSAESVEVTLREGKAVRYGIEADQSGVVYKGGDYYKYSLKGYQELYPQFKALCM